MLVLSRKLGERIQIGSNVTVTVVSISGNRVTLGIEAPRQVRVDRTEMLEKRAGEWTPVLASERSDNPAGPMIVPTVAG